MKYKLISEDIESFVRGKKIVLLWSGGFESTYLVKEIISHGIYKICDLEVFSILFPEDIYDEEKMDDAENYLKSLGIKTCFVSPAKRIDRDSVPYNKACPICKEIRREAINNYLASRSGEKLVFMTGHNLDDVSSYLLENTVNYIGNSIEQRRARQLETSNKFYRVFNYSDTLSIYRPLLRYTKIELEKQSFGVLDDTFSVTKAKCYWINQRKRVLQNYIEQSGVTPDFDKTLEVYKSLFELPREEDFRALGFDTYLL